MVGTSKLLMLLTSPFHLLASRPSVFRLTRHPGIAINTVSSFSKRRYSSSSTTRPLLRCSINPTSRNIHAQTDGINKEDFQDVPNEFATDSRASHPWPEWSKLVDNLRVSGHFDQRKFSSTTSLEQLDWEDTFSMFENMSEKFLQTANACLAFARARPDLLGSLSRKDIETVVEHGHPFLFKASADSMERMQSFLGSGSGSESLFKADTVDLMRFLVSYAHNPSAVRGGRTVGNEQLLESAIRNLLSELVDASTGAQGSNLASKLGDSSTGVHRSNPAGEIVDERFSTPHQSPDGYGQMTRAPRQNIEMKRGDWICSRCQFMNFARNIKCLECNEARPSRQLTGGEWECPQCDFFNYGRNAACLRCDCRRPGEASYGTAESKSRMGHGDQGNVGRADFANLGTVPPQQRLANEQFRGNFSNDGAPQGNNFQSVEGASPGKSSGTSINQSLDRILSRSSTSETNYNAAAAGENYSGIKSSARSGSSPQFSQTNGIKSDYVPFVPLPTDMFAKSQKDSKELVGNNDSIEQKSAVTGKAGDSFSLSEKPVNETESKEEAEKSERWFKKVSELHDVADLTSAISDEDFPEIMPMRKGENRFVVSKKKDRSLTSPLNKRRMAMEQTNSNNFVPFVPFPPDYFAKKDKAPETGVVSAKQEMQPQKSDEHNVRLPTSGSIRNSPQPADNQQTNEGKWSTFSGNSMNENKANYSYPGNSDQRLNNLGNTGGESWNSSSWNDKQSDTASPTGSLAQSANTNDTKESWKGGFTGKSLEGSLVKEPDPLDMSEEAKAERWFRRAAQIKDISELSQIPDEDFPQIMPMRKGVNRFVVSKRKTPLERRLTSPQYRRNLPIVSSEPPKKENNDS